MIICDSRIVVNANDKVNKIDFSDFEVFYKGLLFTSGKKVGKESIEFILSNLIEKGYIDFAPIYGNYCIYIIDKKNNKQYFFVDNSSIFKAYIYKNSISTSFLEIIDYFIISN